MYLFILETNKNKKLIGWNAEVFFVIAADDETEAREIASREDVLESTKHVWKNADKTVCRRIGPATAEQRKGVVQAVYTPTDYIANDCL